MKNINKYLAILLFVFALVSCGEKKEQSNQTKQVKSEKADLVKVIYFYGDYRCPTCRTIEEFSGDAVNEGFENELKSGKLKWETINIDKDENKHFIDDYSLNTMSLVIIKMKDGKELTYKICPKVWELTIDRDEFIKYVQKEIKDYLG